MILLLVISVKRGSLSAVSLVKKKQIYCYNDWGRKRISAKLVFDFYDC